MFASVTETLGLVVLEAMASGLPVIAAPEGGVRDHLRDGVNGVTYARGRRRGDGAGAWCCWRPNGSSRRRLARGARRTAEGLSWERELDRLDASYREVCGRARRRPQAGGSGNKQVTVVPLPRSLSADTRPPCASTRCFTMASPRPVPPSSRERD